ncbi:7985_t:CDS:2, partial [Acaulospora colombiana]
EPTPVPPSPVTQQVHSEEQELRAKIRFMEARRADDVQRIRELETRLADAEAFVALRPKLQAKLNQLQQESLQTKRELQDQATELQVSEAKLTEVNEQLEMVLLDKEVAEERADAAEAEVEELKEKLAVSQDELTILREANSGTGAGGDPSDGKFSLAYIQLERQNGRLRDISQEAEQEYRKKLTDLEKELAASEEMQSEFDATLQKLVNADIQIDSLKQQLDDAMGAEDMLVQLTERNLLLGEKIEEMRVVIEDLEALKELNDELEENHIETEKALQEDIESKESQIREATRKIADLEEAILDYDQTIGQFRELVTQLTTELDALRAEHQSAQSASALAASQTATMRSLNLKLQTTTAKNQAKTIELELQNLKTRQANELLSIIQPYLPQVYVESDGDSTNTYLLFKRMAAKADLLNSTLAERYSLPDSLSGNVTEPLIGICEMRGRIAHLSVLCKRFASVLRRCEPQAFLNIGRIYPDISPLEKRIDGHIDLLKREEFRMVNQFEHLADLYIAESDLDLGERELDLALSLDHDIDFFASAIAWTKTSLLEIFKDD